MDIDVHELVRYVEEHPFIQRKNYRWWTFRCPWCGKDRIQVTYVGDKEPTAVQKTCGSDICSYYLGLLKHPAKQPWPPVK